MQHETPPRKQRRNAKSVLAHQKQFYRKHINEKHNPLASFQEFHQLLLEKKVVQRIRVFSNSLTAREKKSPLNIKPFPVPVKVIHLKDSSRKSKLPPSGPKINRCRKADKSPISHPVHHHRAIASIATIKLTQLKREAHQEDVSKRKRMQKLEVTSVRSRKGTSGGSEEINISRNLDQKKITAGRNSSIWITSFNNSVLP